MAQFEVAVFALRGSLAAQFVAEQFVLVAALFVVLFADLFDVTVALTVHFLLHPMHPFFLFLCLGLVLL